MNGFQGRVFARCFISIFPYIPVLQVVNWYCWCCAYLWMGPQLDSLCASEETENSCKTCDMALQTKPTSLHVKLHVSWTLEEQASGIREAGWTSGTRWTPKLSRMRGVKVTVLSFTKPKSLISRSENHAGRSYTLSRSKQVSINWRIFSVGSCSDLRQKNVWSLRSNHWSCKVCRWPSPHFHGFFFGG